MKIKAYIKPAADKDIQFGEVEAFPKDTEIVIKTTHVGLARGDVFIMENAWKETVYPAIGTAENIGIIEEVGDKTIGFKVGDRVGTGYITSSCMTCTYCKAGLYQYCEKQINTGSGGWGGFAEKIVIDYRLAVKIPDVLDSAIATPLMCYGVTAYSAIMKAKLQLNSKVGIIGLGGLGHILLKILAAMGYDITVFSHSLDKQIVANEFGAKTFILSTKPDWSKKYIKHFDLIINTSHQELQLSDYIVLLKPDGKFCYIGLPFNAQSFQATDLADYGSRCIYGSYVGSTSELTNLLDIAAKKGIRPEILTYPVSEYSKAIQEVKSGIPYKRVVLYW